MDVHNAHIFVLCLINFVVITKYYVRMHWQLMVSLSLYTGVQVSEFTIIIIVYIIVALFVVVLVLATVPIIIALSAFAFKKTRHEMWALHTCTALLLQAYMYYGYIHAYWMYSILNWTACIYRHMFCFPAIYCLLWCIPFMFAMCCYELGRLLHVYLLGMHFAIAYSAWLVLYPMTLVGV